MKKNGEESVDCVGLDCDRSPCRQRCFNCNNFTNRCVDHFLGRSNSEPLCKFCYMGAYKTITNGTSKYLIQPFYKVSIVVSSI
jgi:hypothetical protein